MVVPPLRPPAIVRLINLIGDKVPRFAAKHPALTAGGIGAGIGAATLGDQTRHVENSIMREYVGAPGAKYSSCAVMEKFAERKMTLAARIAFEKDAADSPGGDAFISGMGSGAGKSFMSEGIGFLRRVLGFTAQKVKERSIDVPEQERIIRSVLKNDPVVATFERESPGKAQEAYETMRRFAPTLSTDENATASFLRNSAVSGGPMDFQTIKGIADAETAIHHAQDARAWGKGGF